MPQHSVFMLGQKFFFSLPLESDIGLVLYLRLVKEYINKASELHKIFSFPGVAKIFLEKTICNVVEILPKNPILHH